MFKKIEAVIIGFVGVFSFIGGLIYLFTAFGDAFDTKTILQQSYALNLACTGIACLILWALCALLERFPRP